MNFKKGDKVEKIGSYVDDVHKDGCLATIERDGSICSKFFDIKISALEAYIKDGVFKLIGGGKAIATGSGVIKNNDGRSTCYSCGAPTEDRQGFSSISGMYTVWEIRIVGK